MMRTPAPPLPRANHVLPNCASHLSASRWTLKHLHVKHTNVPPSDCSCAVCLAQKYLPCTVYTAACSLFFLPGTFSCCLAPQDSINVVFAECLRVLEDENQIRAANAMLVR